MRNFKIVFELEVKISSRNYREGGVIGRVISAQSLEIAQKIAEAMIGEEIFSRQYLAKIISIISTDENAFISSFCLEHYTWDRILQRLGLWGEGQAVNFYFSFNKKAEPVKSGIFLSPAQIKHVLARDLKP